MSRKFRGITSWLFRINRGQKFAFRLLAVVSLFKISQMPKKEKISIKVKSKKTDKQLIDEIDKIIEVAEGQNLAIEKILNNKIQIIKYKEEL